MLSQWRFHLIPWHTKGDAAVTQPSSCVEIPQIPDAALLRGALMSPDLL